MPTCRRVRSLRQPRPVNALCIPLRQSQLKITNSLPRKKTGSSSSQPDRTQELTVLLPQSSRRPRPLRLNPVHDSLGSTCSRKSCSCSVETGRIVSSKTASSRDLRCPDLHQPESPRRSSPGSSPRGRRVYKKLRYMVTTNLAFGSRQIRTKQSSAWVGLLQPILSACLQRSIAGAAPNKR
jgi:hypothetical protein